MQKYITLWKYTKEGLVDIKNTEERYATVNEIVKTAGGRMIDAFGLIGDYDVVTIMEMPNEKALCSAIMKICSKGRVIPKTLTAIEMDEFLKITKED